MGNPKPLLLSSLTLLIITAITAADLQLQLQLELELETAMSALRSAGYNLFPNAIATTDLRYHILSSSSSSSNDTTKFTLFSPPDSFLFSLDFSSSANRYFLSLLRHVSPLRLPSTDLLNIATNPDDESHTVPSLLRGHGLVIRTSPTILLNGTESNSLAVNGVQIVAPDLFVGPGIVVHGLERIILGDDPVSGFSLEIREGLIGHQSNRDGDLGFGSIQMLVDNEQKGEKKPEHGERDEGIKNGHNRFFKFG